MFLKANRIHDGKQFLPMNTALEVDDEGRILNILAEYFGEATEFEGILCPAFINTHCHLELSHLKGFIPKHTGLISFLQQVTKGRNAYSETEKATARNQAYQELHDNGVIAVGDIANTTDTLDLMPLKKLYLHSFVEAIGFNPSLVEKSFSYAKTTYDSFLNVADVDATSITLHAPYSVSDKLFERVSFWDKSSILSIHNQECKDENWFYINKSGAVNSLLHHLNIDTSHFTPSGTTSLQTYSQWISTQHQLLLVHNSFTSREDIQQVKHLFTNLFFCLCPNANLYIENTLPDVPLLMEEEMKICIGTDSLASNDQLCIYSELKTLQQHFDIDWELLLQWATYNGAQALRIEDRFGSLGIGMKPGIVHIYQDAATRIV